MNIFITFKHIIIRRVDIFIFQSSSRGLSAVIFFGITLANLSVVAFLFKPTTFNCHLSIYGFMLSVAIIYSPILVKTNRIYRIFSAGRKGNKRPGMINSKAMIILTSLLVLGEVLNCFRYDFFVIQFQSVKTRCIEQYYLGI